MNRKVDVALDGLEIRYAVSKCRKARAPSECEWYLLARPEVDADRNRAAITGMRMKVALRSGSGTWNVIEAGRRRVRGKRLWEMLADLEGAP